SAALLAGFSLRLGWKPIGAALVGIAWALNPMSIAFATGGMETSVFVLAALGALALTARASYLPLAAGIAGVATLVRPEGALLATAVVGWTFLVRRRQTVPVALVGGAPMVIAG